MKGYITVKALKPKTGIYASELDYDRSFADKDNPKGLFKMVIEPIMNNDGKYEIRYMRSDEGYIVSGEAYIVSYGSEAKINDYVLKHFMSGPKYKPLIHTEGKSMKELW